MTAKNIIRFIILISWALIALSSHIFAAQDPLINVQKINPHIRGVASHCYLRKPVAMRLDGVQKELKPLGLGLKIMDAYRPLSEQRKLWKENPDNHYVANPKHGSRHNRGAAVDLRLVRLDDGKELTLPPTSFSRACQRNYEEMPSEEMKKNCKLLELIMEKHGFIPLPTEWWHFDDKNWAAYDVLNIAINTLQEYDDDALLTEEAPIVIKKTVTKKKKPIRKKRTKKPRKKKLTIASSCNKVQ